MALVAGGRAGAFIRALGGAGNLAEVEACTTRLRLVVADGARIDEPALKRLGARGIVRPSATDLQVVLGPIADQVAGEIRAALRTAPPGARAGPDPSALLAALGGRANVLDLGTAPGRLLLKLARVESIDEAALRRAGVRGVARPGGAALHVLVAGPIDDTAAPLRTLLASA
ncbi:MAG TPA: PTS transporter subunit EIIB, partial [Steroidobacteraceae bacterium]